MLQKFDSVMSALQEAIADEWGKSDHDAPATFIQYSHYTQTHRATAGAKIAQRMHRWMAAWDGANHLVYIDLELASFILSQVCQPRSELQTRS
ncbi:MAG: hypothetical protein ACK47M_00725 [Caldilinea sp.]